MNAYFTRLDSDFARELAALLSGEGHAVYAGEQRDGLERMDLFIASQDVREPDDDFTVLDGVNPDAVMRSVRENLVEPIKALEAALPALDRGELRRVCFLTSGAYASVNFSHQTRGYGYAMSKAALSQAARICYNRLYPQGYTFRMFDPLIGLVPAREAAFAARECFLRSRAYDPDNPGRTDEARFVLRDALGREWPW